jgi:hypothetical protein
MDDLDARRTTRRLAWAGFAFAAPHLVVCSKKCAVRPRPGGPSSGGRPVAILNAWVICIELMS